MNEYFIKIMHLATGLASLGFAVICVSAAFFAAVTVISVLFTVAGLGFLIYGLSTYSWAFFALFSPTVAPPVLLARLGLMLALIAIIGLALI